MVVVRGIVDDVLEVGRWGSRRRDRRDLARDDDLQSCVVRVGSVGRGEDDLDIVGSFSGTIGGRQ